jgi:peptidoglycan/LPS O-acetylase OafA/YrhL
LIFCGEVSFAFYLIHLIVLEALLRVRGQASTAPQLLLLVAASLSISCVLAVILHKLVELPLQSRISRLLDARMAALPQSR